MSEHEQRIRDAVGMVGSWADEHYITAARNDLRALLLQRLDAAIRTSEGGAGRGMTDCTILPWYSCPKSEEGCANEFEGDDCTCGADKHNAMIDAALSTPPPAAP